MIPGDLDRGLGSDVWIRKAKENSFLGRAQGTFLDGKGSASSEGGMVVWGGGRRHLNAEPPVPLLHDAGQTMSFGKQMWKAVFWG